MTRSEWDIRVDTLGFLANNLRGYEPTSILREQLQNTDDATFKQGRRGELRMAFREDRLVVTNPSVFSDDDWFRITRPNSRGKFHDAEQTGEFGVGFWGSLHLTDAPIVTSGTRRVRLDPLGTEVEAVSYVDGTEIEFVYRRARTQIGDDLDAGLITPEVERAMADEFIAQMAELLLFTRSIDSIVIELRDGTVRRASRTITKVADVVDRLDVTVEGAPDENCSVLVVRALIEDPPLGRHGRVTVALPLTARHRGPGRVFFMFPTETDSGLRLSIDAHFRSTDDRRSLENSGVHGEWNDRIFRQAGRAVGRSLETLLDPAVHGLAPEEAVLWFSKAGSHLPDVQRRAELFMERLDDEAHDRCVVLDRNLKLRRGQDLVDLPAEVESILGGVVGDAAYRPSSPLVRDVYQRWGLVSWGAAEVAGWLAKHTPREKTALAAAPSFLRDPSDVV